MPNITPNILLVDDDQLFYELYEMILKDAGFDVTLARDGMEGLDKIAQRKPDLILLDIMMPKMNGFEMLEKLKNNPETKDIPVVILTNLSGEKEEEVAQKKGVIKYVIKSQADPPDIPNLIKEILKV
ncbi:response regulator [Candidatus Daviesbacteria bacterium]|nr:response regulator [Candidatus Daviesbacteria bacterium]